MPVGRLQGIKPVMPCILLSGVSCCPKDGTRQPGGDRFPFHSEARPGCTFGVWVNLGQLIRAAVYTHDRLTGMTVP